MHILVSVSSGHPRDGSLEEAMAAQTYSDAGTAPRTTLRFLADLVGVEHARRGHTVCGR
jgi:hypothetical protein